MKKTKESYNMGAEHQVKTSLPESPDDDDDIETRCGLGGCKPNWLRKFGSVQSFVGFVSVSNLLALSLKMYFISQITTLEKRFGFSSSQSGLIVSSSQIGFLVVILFISYYGRNSHIPKILSGAGFIIGLTGLVFGTAYFLPQSGTETSRRMAGNQTFSNGSSSSSGDVCTMTNENIPLLENTCGDGSENTAYSGTVAMAIFLVAMLIQGAASAPRAPLGGTYVDDNNPIPTRSGKYVGIMTGIYTLAPILSFGFGSASSGIYHTLQATDLTPRDPRWIGAWWLGFVTLGSVTCLSAIVILCFPRKLKSAKLKPVENPTSTAVEENKVNVWTRIKGPFTGAFRLLKNPIFMPVALCGTFQICALMGTASFITKYMETQFYVPAFKANLLLGGISLLGSSTGPIVGGLVTSRFKLTTSGNLRLIMVVSLVITLCCPIAMVIAGTQTNVIQNNLPGASNETAVASCVSDCFCEKNDFRPICGTDGVTYFSPCTAGCTKKKNRDYSDCSCIVGGNATAGYCAEEDNKVYILLLYMTLNSFAITFTMSSAFLIFVRNVSEKDKALAIALPSFLSTVLGHFPGPIVYGAIVDSSCKLWRETCAGRGACDLYDLETFRLRMFGANMGLFFLAAICVVIAVIAHKIKESKSPQKEEPVTKDQHKQQPIEQVKEQPKDQPKDTPKV